MAIPALKSDHLSCFLCCRWEVALWLMEEMVEMGLTPDKTSYLYGIDACTDEGAVDEVSYCFHT